jgi:hypothetical protein
MTNNSQKPKIRELVKPKPAHLTSLMEAEVSSLCEPFTISCTGYTTSCEKFSDVGKDTDVLF